MSTSSFQSHSFADPGKLILFFCLPILFPHFIEQPFENPLLSVHLLLICLCCKTCSAALCKIL